MTTCLIYSRVSSNRQEEEGASLDTQRGRCEAFAAEHDYQVIGVFSDTHTGAQWRERPGLSALREQVRAGGVVVVLAYALDRLSRNQAHTYIIAEEVETHGARLEFVTESFEDSAVGRFIRSAKAFAAEVEREKIIERSMRGRLARVQSGKLLPGVRPLYGYQWRDADKAALDVNPASAPTVRWIFEQAALGASTRSIAQSLNADGTPTPAGAPRWTNATVWSILKNPNYTGAAHGWAWRAPEAGRAISFDPEHAVALPDGTIPPLVEPAAWEIVQARLQENRHARRSMASYRDATLMRGHAYCGYCGHRMYVKRKPPKLIYVCESRYNHGTGCTLHSCDVTVLDAAAWRRVRRVLLKPELIQVAGAGLLDARRTAQETATLERELTQIERRQATLARRIAEETDDAVAAPLLTALRQLGAQQRAYVAELDALRARTQHEARAQAELDVLSEWCARVAGNVDQLDFSERRLAIEMLGIEARVYRRDAPRPFTLSVNPRVGQG